MMTDSMPYRELLLGCGNRRTKDIGRAGHETWQNLTTLDIDRGCRPDRLFDLRTIRLRAVPEPVFIPETIILPFSENIFDEIHAYEVLEHCGAQGDHRLLLDQFSEFWRILKPGGLFFATVPDFRGLWAWGDPSHSRVINQGTLVFLNQQSYTEQVGKTSMSDYRRIYRADFQAIESGFTVAQEGDERGSFYFILQAVKPSRCVP
jgi:SAM-dependent methyltransferase